MQELIGKAPFLAFKNKDLLKDNCSCYHCCKNFKLSEITQWTDEGQTALCPFCSVDAVLEGHIQENILKSINKYWFYA